MVQYCALSRGRLHLTLALWLSLACKGEISTPYIELPRDQFDNDDRTADGQPLSMPNVTRMDGGAAPNQNDDSECAPITVAGLSVTVGSPDFECDDLRVIATAPDFEEELACSLRDERCRCFGAHDRPGTYRVSVEAGDPPV